MHQSPCYPGTGSLFDVGSGRGRGFNANLPLQPGQGDSEYHYIVNTLFAPIIIDFAPEIILVSAGFDPHRLDPLGGMNLSGSGFASMAAILTELADTICDGRILFLLEGGYSLEALPGSAQALIDAATGRYSYDEKSCSTNSPDNELIERFIHIQSEFRPGIF